MEMPRYYYRYRRSYRRRPRRYVRRWFRRKVYRFVNGSSKSIVRIKVPISATFSLSAGPAGAVNAQAIRCYASTQSNPFTALNSPLYRLYCSLYEEVKCIGGKVTLSIGTPIGTSSVPSATFITAWDRRCSGGGAETSAPTYDELLNYSSQQKAVAVNNSIAKLNRSCYASDLMEKAQWHDCTLIESGSAPNYNYADAAYNAAGNNPNFFCPGMWIGVSQSGSVAQTIQLQADIIWYFAFRNPKYGAGAGGSAKDVSMRALPEFEDLDGDLTLDDEMDTKVGDAELETAAAALRSARIAATGSAMSAKLRAESRAKLMDHKVVMKRQG